MFDILKLYKTLLPYQKKYLMLLIFFMFIGMFFEIFGISLIIPLITILVSDDFSNIKYFEYFGINNFEKISLLYIGTSIIFIVYLIKSIFLLFLLWQQSNFAKHIQTYTSDNLFNLYLNQNYLYHAKNNSSILIRNVNNTSNIEVILHSACSTILEILILLGIGSLLFYLNPITAFLTLITIFIISFLFHNLSKKFVENWGQIKLKHDAKRLQYLQQGLGAIKEIKIFNKEIFFFSLFSNHNNSYAEVNKKRVILLNSTRIFLEFIAILGFSLIIFLTLNQNNSVEYLLTTLGVFTAAAFRLLPSFNRILVNFNNIRHSMPFLRIYLSEIGRLKINKINKKQFKNIFKINNKLQLNNINFSYNRKKVLENFSLEIKKGEYLGIVGASGSGKSTLVDIILGLIKVDSGNILIDKKSIYENLFDWQSIIGYVPQDVYLSDDTLSSNIAFGINKNDIDDKKLKDAIRISELDEFVNNLEFKEETFLGERGARISGGQKQRIGIARALYINPEIIIFDEATSSLDSVTEENILSFINTLKRKKTIISISHNHKTLTNCDRIINLGQE